MSMAGFALRSPISLLIDDDDWPLRPESLPWVRTQGQRGSADTGQSTVVASREY